jgi:hypothetical protein
MLFCRGLVLTIPAEVEATGCLFAPMNQILGLFNQNFNKTFSVKVDLA